ncbi:FAD-dependent monooxygenase [Sagittula sp. SSi028]|uniref:FAD-dependent monooxygenase n=1 Tax=Sagittula sp. SSi028 TaxID=3400636 RepID=UPI003AF84048
MAKVIVVGAGIGGLAAALCLRMRGFDVSIIEQAPELREIGAGLQISPNGARVLDALGLGQQLRAASVCAQAVRLRDGLTGSDVATIPVGGGDNDAYRFIHRADLIDLLARRVTSSAINLVLGQAVVGFQDGAQPSVSLATGELLHGDYIVAADGLNSRARPYLNGTETPFFTGQVAWRAVVPNIIGHPAEAHVHMGKGRHLVTYPLRDGKLVNIVAVEERSEWAAAGWSHTDSAENLQHAFRSFAEDVQILLGAVEVPGLWGLFRHPVAQHWHGEKLALLGDAAHPTLPFLAQGANMALEDGWALAQAMADDGRLDIYQDWRRDRVSRVVAAANGNAWKYHLRNPIVRRTAHIGLHAVSRFAPERLKAQFEWLYDYDVTTLGKQS